MLRATGALDPDALVRGVYRHFDHGGSGVRVTARTAGDWFDPAMTALIRADVRQAKGEAPMLDGDPFCDCQDMGEVTYAIRTVRLSPRRAVAHVQFTDDGVSRPFRLELARTSAGWRVSDIRNPYTPGLKRLLTQGLRDARRR